MIEERLTADDVRRIGQSGEVLSRRNAEHWASLLYARRISPHVTVLAHRVGLSANALTMIMVLVGLTGAAVMLIPGVVPAVISVVVIQIYLILDCSDGELARVTRTQSGKGVYLDRLGHYLVEAILLVAVGVRSSEGDLIWVAMGLLAALAAAMIKVQGDLIEVSRFKAGLRPTDEAYESSSSAAKSFRRIAQAIPIHRVFGAVELSAVILLATLADLVLDSGHAVEQGLVVGLLAVAVVGIPARAWMVLKSDRLDS